MQISAGTVYDPGTIADRLRIAMERKELNPNQIERKMSMSGYHLPRQTIGNILNGITKQPTTNTTVLLADFLGVRRDWLATGELPMLPAPSLNDSEVQLVLHYRRMSGTHQADLCDIAARWAEADGGDSDPNVFHLQRPPQRPQ